ncbi:MAG TPA: UPF0182 family protein, partial [Vicinamibacterales bacterium]
MRSLRIVVIIAAAGVFFVFPAMLDFLADWLWFGEVGYRQVYSTEISARAIAGGLSFVIAMAWLAVNARLALAAMSPGVQTFQTRDGLTVALPTRDQVQPLLMILAAIGSLLVASFVSSQWITLLSWWQQVPFGKSDPILGHDAAMYVFTLPAMELLRGLGLALVLLAAVGVTAIYFAAGQVVLTPFGLRVEDRARRHLAWLGVALFLMLAAGAWLNRLQEIVSTSGIIQGASYADVYGRIPAALAHALAALVGAALCAATALGNSNRHAIAAAVIYGLVMLGGEGYASLLQRFAVTPNEQVRETPFMEYNIAAT